MRTLSVCCVGGRASRRGWSVAFPGFKVFDLVQRCWVLDPLKTLGNCHNAHVAHGGQFPEEDLGCFRINELKKISFYLKVIKMINCKKKRKVSSTRKLFEIMYDNMPTSESYNHLNIIITDLVVN